MISSFGFEEDLLRARRKQLRILVKSGVSHNVREEEYEVRVLRRDPRMTLRIGLSQERAVSSQARYLEKKIALIASRSLLTG